MTYICINELLRYCHRAAYTLSNTTRTVADGRRSLFYQNERVRARAPAKKKHNFIGIKQRDACYSHMKSSCAFDLSFDS